jgi:nucleotide-binding universal stress UspA family protein
MDVLLATTLDPEPAPAAPAPGGAEGAELARRHGLDAEARAVPAVPSVWETIVRVADEEDASAIVLGSRGLRGLRALTLGSVSN